MLEKAGGTFVANCDFCSNYTDTEEAEWQSAIDKMKRLGWQVFKKMGEWFHKCELCQDSSDDFEEV